jgi:hypothetical protein
MLTVRVNEVDVFSDYGHFSIVRMHFYYFNHLLIKDDIESILSSGRTFFLPYSS